MTEDFDSSDEDEMIYIVIKDESNDENDKMDLISYISKNNTWIIESGCSQYMTGDNSKFEHLILCWWEC